MDSSDLQEFDFSDYEIREQLELLGFKNISGKKFDKFKEDLKRLVQSEKSSDESAIFTSKLDEIQREQFSKRGINIHSIDSDEDVNDKSTETYTNEEDNDESTSNSEIYTSRESNTRTRQQNPIKKKVITRKVARKVDNGRICIESQSLNDYNQSTTGSVSYLNDNFANLNVNDDVTNEKDESDNTLDNDNEEIYIEDELNTKEEELNRPKSFIRPSSVLSARHDDLSRIRRNNPVSRYQQYSKIWNKQKAPGEKNHNSLRWSIREQMLEKHELVKRPVRAVTPRNEYMVPTEKKRKELRWNVRTAMAGNARLLASTMSSFK